MGCEIHHHEEEPPKTRLLLLDFGYLLVIGAAVFCAVYWVALLLLMWGV